MADIEDPAYGSIDEAEFRQWLAVASLFWFVFATLFATRSRAA